MTVLDLCKAIGVFEYFSSTYWNNLKGKWNSFRSRFNFKVYPVPHYFASQTQEKPKTLRETNGSILKYIRIPFTSKLIPWIFFYVITTAVVIKFKIIIIIHHQPAPMWSKLQYHSVSYGLIVKIHYWPDSFQFSLTLRKYFNYFVWTVSFFP